MAKIADETRARDLLRRGELEERATLGEGTVLFVVGRQFRRPVGCSAKLFKRFGVEDPFEPPKQGFRREHKPVYAAGRFVRIDNAKKQKLRNKFGVKGTRNPWWVKQMNDRAAGLGNRPKPLREAKPRPRGAPKPRDTAPRQVHTPDGSAPTGPIDRTPPRVASPVVERPRSGRILRSRPQKLEPPGPRPPMVDGEIDRTPPRVEHTPTGGQPRHGRTTSGPAPDDVDRRPPLIRKAHATDHRETVAMRTGVTDQPDDGVDRRPPRVRHVPTNVQGEAITEVVRRRRRRRAGLPEETEIDRQQRAIDPTRPPPPIARAEPDAAAPDDTTDEPPAPPVRRPPTKTGGLDDLFGGMQEGRVRIGRAERPKESNDAEPEPAKAKPEETIDRRPPLIRKAPPPKPDFVPPPPEIEMIEPDPEPDEDDLPPPPPKKPENDVSLDDLFGAPSPPRRRVARGPMSLDDLFGAPQEGRVKIGRREKRDPNAANEAEDKPAEADEIDRTPPKFDLAPDEIPKG